jgi:DNA-binding response OmpR family regulator
MALELGATRCLRKPFTPVALLAVINECLAEVREPCPNKIREINGRRAGRSAEATSNRCRAMVSR